LFNELARDSEIYNSLLIYIHFSGKWGLCKPF